MSTKGEAPPHKPNIEVQNAWCICERRENFALDRDSVMVDLVVEGFAEDNDILVVGSWLMLDLCIGEPQVHGIKKMKTRAVNHLAGAGLLFRTEENSGRKNSLETFDDASIMPAVFGEVKELEKFPQPLGIAQRCSFGGLPAWQSKSV